MSSIRRFGIRVFGCNILLDAAEREAHTVLERYVFPSFPRAIDADGTFDIRIRVLLVADRFQLSVDDAVVASASRAVHLVPDLIRALDEKVIECTTGLRAVHAGAVLLGGKALLLPGSTHAGKSSLVAELLRRGALYFSDEYALIDREGLVHPYPRPLLLRNGCSEQHPMLPEECDAVVGNSPAQVGWIMLLEYIPACAWSIEPIPQSEALLALLRNTPHELAGSTELIETFRRAVSGAACYQGRRPEAAEAVDQILHLVANS